MANGESKLKIIMPDKINGHKKTGKGVYVPTQKSLQEVFRGLIPKADELPASYVSQENEVKKLVVAHKIGKAALLSGPTGVGKSLLVRQYAVERGLPLLAYVANEDATDYKMRGSLDMAIIPMQDENGAIHDVKLKAFSPNQVSLAAMSDQPVVLFIDELHKIRPGVTSLLHSIVNSSERTLYCYELAGQNYRLHPDTFVVGALNPSYGEGGIDRLDAALRRRFATIPLDMPSEEKVVEIVQANILNRDEKDAKGKVTDVVLEEREFDNTTQRLVEVLANIQASIYQAREINEGASPSTVVGDTNLNSETLSSIIEVPSPASIVDTIKSVLAGLDVMSSIEMNMIDTIVTDFGSARKALIAFMEGKIPESLRS